MALVEEPGAAGSVSLPSALHLAASEAAHAVFRRRIRVDTSRTDCTEADARGERKPLVAKRGEKCGLTIGGGITSLDETLSLFPRTTGEPAFDPERIAAKARTLDTSPAIDLGHPFPRGTRLRR